MNFPIILEDETVMRDSLRTGLSFGLTSGTITTLGLMVGLHAGTHLGLAVAVSVIYGLALLAVFTYSFARQRNEKPWKAIFEHLLIAAVVIALTHQVGDWIRAFFG